MADLDDFFAKKDKKKSKGKKFTTVDQVAKKLEDTSKKPADVRPKKDKDKYGQDGENVANNMQEEDEWKEFEEEKKDYSGLKIQNMQLNDSQDGAGGQRGEDDDSEDGDGEGGRGRKAAGPWKVKSTDQEKPSDSDEEDDEEEAPAPAESEPKRPEVKDSAYIAPHLRYASAAPTGGGGGHTPHSMKGKSKAAPDINNEAYFPTLSAAASTEPAGPWGKKNRNREDERGFEDVRNSKSHSSRFEPSRPGATSGGGPPGRVMTENKWDALRHSDQS